MKMTTAEALIRVMESTALCNSNLEPASIVDVVGELARNADKVADGLIAISLSIDDLAKAVKESKCQPSTTSS